jgi:hypothetical protein
MESIIQKVDIGQLLEELTSDIFVRPTNNGNNEIYIFDGNLKPALMNEVGRLRELTFRQAGGGTGKSSDIDEFDLGENPYYQLIVWDPIDQEIVGGYRYVKCKNNKINENDYFLSTSEILLFSDKIKIDYFPYTIELGRSFVQPNYQPSQNNRKGLFSLDNLWDGLGALIILNPEIKYFFGKVTMYTNFNRHARDLILSFINYFFPDPENLAFPKSPLVLEYDCSEFISEVSELEYKAAYIALSKKVKSLGEQVPPLFNSYMSLSPTMKSFGTCVNHHFGDLEETGILVTINDIYSNKKERHVESFIQWKSSLPS